MRSVVCVCVRSALLAVLCSLGSTALGIEAASGTEQPQPLALALSHDWGEGTLAGARPGQEAMQPWQTAEVDALVAPAPPLQLRADSELKAGTRRWRPQATDLAEASASASDRVDNVGALRLDDAEFVTLDGRLDEPFWSRAQNLHRFYQVDPVASDDPPVKTEARFAFDAKTLYVAITAHDPDPSALQAPLSRRDDLAFNQDRVTVYIDSIGDRRSARFFEVNPEGVLVDGVFDELTASDDIGPDFRFQVRTSRLAGGWSVEMAIPFASLPSLPDTTKPWTVLVARFYPRQEFFYLASGPLPLNCTLCVASELRGLQRLPHAPAVEGVAHAEVRRRLDRSEGGSGSDRTRLRAGVEASFRPRSDTVLRMAIRPEAAGHGIDEPLLDADRDQRTDLPENRPLFIDAADIVQSPLNLLNTRSVVQPEAGVGVTHRSASWDGAAWLIRDAGAHSLLQPDPGHPASSSSDVLLLRGRHFTAAGRWGALLSHRKALTTPARNTVLALDGSVRLGEENLFQVQWAHSHSSNPESQDEFRVQDTAKRASWSHEGDALSADLAWQRVGGGFRAEVGTIESPGTEQIEVDVEGAGMLSWHDAGPILRLERSRSLSTADRSDRRALGAYAQLPMETRIEWLPWMTSREGNENASPARLLRLQQIRLSSVPVHWISDLSLELTWGDALFKQDHRVGSGHKWLSTLWLQPGDDLQVRWSSELQSIRATAGGLSRASLNQWMVLWMPDARSHVRGLLQRRSTTAADGSAGKDTEMAYSLAYQREARAGYTLDAGVTRRHKRTSTASVQNRSQQVEWFSSLSWPFQ